VISFLVNIQEKQCSYSRDQFGANSINKELIFHYFFFLLTEQIIFLANLLINHYGIRFVSSCIVLS